MCVTLFYKFILKGKQITWRLGGWYYHHQLDHLNKLILHIECCLTEKQHDFRDLIVRAANIVQNLLCPRSLLEFWFESVSEKVLCLW